MLIKIYPQNPNRRDVMRVADAIAAGDVVILPTDTIYAFACSIEFKKAFERMAALKGFTARQAHYSLLCSSLSMASDYIRPLDKEKYQLLRSTLPGPFTYILDASNNVPRHCQNPGRTIGIRVPDNAVCQAIIDAVGAPLVATSVKMDLSADEPEYITDPELIHETFGAKADIVIDGGTGSTEPSTVVDCTGDEINVVRQGQGNLSRL